MDLIFKSIKLFYGDLNTAGKAVIWIVLAIIVLWLIV